MHSLHAEIEVYHSRSKYRENVEKFGKAEICPIGKVLIYMEHPSCSRMETQIVMAVIGFYFDFYRECIGFTVFHFDRDREGLGSTVMVQNRSSSR